MASTVADGAPFVNPPAADLGRSGRDLYDWLKIVTRLGGIRRHMDLTPPVSRYEQVASLLRERIVGGEFPAGSKLPSGAQKGQYPVSQPVVQRAFEVLEREGLVRMTPGSGTEVLPRVLWRVEFGAPAGPGAAAVRRVAKALSAAVSQQPAVASAQAEMIGDGVRIVLTVESADLGGAVTASLPVARQALGSLPVAAMSAREA